MHYVIHQDDGIQFFATESEAIEYHEEAYFACATDPMPVPEDSIGYTIMYGNEVKAVFTKDQGDLKQGWFGILLEE